MVVYLGKIAKRANSTYIPELTELVSYDGAINEDFLLTGPMIRFNFGGSTSAPVFNYAYVPAFKRYYFITAWNFTAGLWLASMTVDVLASYKDDIAGNSLYVLRAASTYDGSIPDTKYPAKATRGSDLTTRTSPFAVNASNGCYVVGIINKQTGTGNSRVGAVQYYVMTPSWMETFLNRLFSDIDYMDVDTSEVSAELQTMLVNPFQYVVSAMWFPFKISAYASAVNIPCGWWTLKNVNGQLFTSPYTELSFDMTIPKHPQTGSRGSWVNLSPYTTYSLEIWPFGVIPLDSAKLVNITTVTVRILVDHITGVGTLTVEYAGVTLASSTAQIGVPLQLAQMSVDYGRLQGTTGLAVTAAGATALAGVNSAPTETRITLGSIWQGVKNAASGAWSGVKAIASGNAGQVIQSVTQGAADIGNAAASILADVETSGGNGGRAAFAKAVKINMHYSPITDDDNAHEGRPLCQTVRISSLSGYIQCKHGDISINTATRGELDLIRAYLEGGFYYE